MRSKCVSNAGQSSMANILIVEDEPKMRRLLEISLGEDGHHIQVAPDAETALKNLHANQFDVVVTDVKLPGMNGLEFLQEAKRLNASMPIVVMTAYGSVETAMEAMKLGASDYVLKPFTMAEMKLVVAKEIDVQRVRDENRSLKEALGQRYHFNNIVARSAPMQAVLALVERVAPTNSTVLIGGESGVGKDLIARAIHQNSRRASGPFIKINSTAIPDTLFESELFGFERGAFTGALASKPGKFELADRGTLFLDEIGDVPAAIQVKLLRVLQEREFERLGGTKTLKVDVRLLAATNRDLRAALEEGTFREDLYYRLNVVPIDIPPLREHKEDIPELVKHFVDRFAAGNDRDIRGVTPGALNLLIDYHWPGNVRQLENTIERAVALSSEESGNMIDVADIHLDSPRGKSAAPAGNNFLPEGMTLEQWEEEMIREALRRASGNKSQAARLLGLSRNALRYRLGKMGVEDEES